MGASDFWDEFEKTFGRLRKDLERSWKAKYAMGDGCHARVIEPSLVV